MSTAKFSTMSGAKLIIDLVGPRQADPWEFESQRWVEVQTEVEITRVVDLYGPKAIITLWDSGGYGSSTYVISQIALPPGWLELARDGWCEAAA